MPPAFEAVGDEAVADARLSKDVAACAGCRLQLLPQSRDVHVQRVRLGRVAGAPHRVGNQCDAHPGKQFIHPERFGQIIVGALIQRGHFVAFRFARGQHNHGRARSLADGAQHFQTVHVWQTEVQQHQVRPHPVVSLERACPRRGDIHSELVSAEVRLDRA
jgi:hypothetical protein